MISLGRLRILGPVTIRAPTKIVLKSERWTQDKHNANFNCRTHWTHQGLKTAQLLQFKFLWLKQKPVGLHELVRWITICIAGSSLPTSSGLRALLHKFSRFISRLWNVIGWNSTIKVSGLCVQSPVTQPGASHSPLRGAGPGPDLKDADRAGSWLGAMFPYMWCSKTLCIQWGKGHFNWRRDRFGWCCHGLWLW